jgi:hypothetical protein
MLANDSTTTGTPVSEGNPRLYSTLQPSEIRLLTLFPSIEYDSPINCTLSKGCLETQKLSYVALSYRWGEPSPFPNISVNNQPVFATLNLEIALRHFRHETESLTLWVDAVCIDQRHEVESLQQTQNMRKIYSRAKETWVWLGEDADRSEDAIDLIESLAKDIPHDWTADEEHGLLALDELFAREYWYRVWVVQEIAVSRNIKIFCGRRQFDWDPVYRAAEVLNRDVASGDVIRRCRVKRGFGIREKGCRPGIQRVIAIQSIRNDCLKPDRNVEAEPSDSLLFLLSSHRTTEATEARDKYFAIAGLIEDERIEQYETFTLPSPDEPPDVREIYVWAAQQVAQQQIQPDSLALDFLDCAGQHRGEEKLSSSLVKWPSWVPDWSLRYPRSPLLYWQFQRRKDEVALVNAPYRKGSQTTTDPTFSISRKDGRLTARGFTLDVVAAVGPSEWSQESSPNTRLSGGTRELRSSTSQSHLPNFGGQQLEEVVWRTYVLDRDPRGRRPPAEWGALFYHLTQNQPWYDQNQNLKIQNQTLSDIRHQQLLKPYLHPTQSNTLPNIALALKVALEYRRMAVTYNGFLCMAPWDAEPEDVIVVLWDCCAPVVLRRVEQEDHDKHWKFIGTCYVHGIMQGEAVVGMSCEERFAEAFDIR